MSLPVLHIWPGQWGLPSIDPLCLAAFMYLQSTIPSKFMVSYCTNPDFSPSGTLPFLTHNQQAISSLSSIIQYLGRDPQFQKDVKIDANLNSLENSQKTAWCSHIESNLGSLVSYMFYSLPANWAQLTHPTLTYALSVPQRYYMPNRIRDTHRPRLEAAGLWSQQPTESKRSSLPSYSISFDDKEEITHTFQREKALQKARDFLDIYTRLLGENQFVYQERPTTLDFVLAAHVLVISRPPFPDKLLSDLLTSSYSTVVLHAERILSRALENPAPVNTLPLGHSIRSLLPSLPRERAEKSAEETHYDRVTWGWISLAVGSVSLYLLIIGSPVHLVVS
ncbi:outer mitochondrial membrane transport complex protein-domain-containing protein [Mycena pura]|uniref:Outer mitochondrial membrane transport complex protein-domain-containing protein n=1 Tax=Mycena pura TaxID=153505 RepID=A0AAD6YIH4_9AGAR|nr:outer mitochondrial membrane transport complex protein-domain-containing protein [Mycena pura]